MKDILNQLNHLDCEIADCELIAKMAVDPAKRELFNRLVEQYRKMRDDLRQVIKADDAAA